MRDRQDGTAGGAERRLSAGVKYRPIMVMGTTSGAGKSFLVTALCRILSDEGLKVAPYKAQNMSLNSCVTEQGEEIARIQELQARAARTRAEGAMNPILLKPKGDAISQVIVMGRPYRDMDVKEYYGHFVNTEGREILRRSFQKLAAENDIVVIEGAGSPAEINIADGDIANMGAAEIADAACILAVNSEWGGMFAYLVGTIMLLEPQQRVRFKGIVINNFRGDPDCLRSGIERVERELGIPVLGVVPHMDTELPTEDSMFIGSKVKEGDGIRIGVVRLPRISNFTDFDALTLEESVSVVFVSDPDQLDQVDAIILPGTKNTIVDLNWLEAKGFAGRITQLAGKVPILGICGGYQMLGQEIVDEKGIEGGSGQRVKGLGLLPVVTTFDAYEKCTVQVEARLASNGARVRGYEIHMGRSEVLQGEPLFLVKDEKGEHPDGTISSDGMVMGTYLHGLFDLPAFRKRFLASMSEKHGHEESGCIDTEDRVEASIQKSADIVRANIDMEAVFRMLEGGRI